MNQPPIPNFDALLRLLGRSGAGVPPELVSLLSGLLQLLESLPAGARFPDSLKRAGAWPGVPLPPNTPEQPYYVNIAAPTPIEIVNVSRPALVADLHRHPVVPDGFGNSKITIPAPRG